MNNLVYGLGDPRTGEMRYIGVTNNIYKRYAKHLLYPHKADGEERNTWLKELEEYELIPTLVILESGLSKKDAHTREQYWINHYIQAGAPLTNIKLAIYTSAEVISSFLGSEDAICTSEVVRIWNERASAENKQANYNRFHVYRRRNFIGGIDTPSGYQYSKRTISTMPLPRCSKYSQRKIREKEV